MTLYLLTRTIGDAGYDEMLSVVVRAASEADARRLAASHSKDEGHDPWLNAKLSICEALPENGPEEVICENVQWG